MNIHEFNAARRVYLTDDEDILARCAVGVYRTNLRVHLPFGMSYCNLTATERSVVWAFERVIRTELAGVGRTWVYRGLSDNEPTLEDIRNPLVIYARVLKSALFEPGYEELVDDERTVDHGWARFVEVTEVRAEGYLDVA